jgi:hypothetical protein
MKFYKNKFNNDFDINLFFDKILAKKLTFIYSGDNVSFFKNGESHNDRNASLIISKNTYKAFKLNGEFYGDEKNFTKQSWRKFVKMQVFL